MYEGLKTLCGSDLAHQSLGNKGCSSGFHALPASSAGQGRCDEDRQYSCGVLHRLSGQSDIPVSSCQGMLTPSVGPVRGNISEGLLPPRTPRGHCGSASRGCSSSWRGAPGGQPDMASLWASHDGAVLGLGTILIVPYVSR